MLTNTIIRFATGLFSIVLIPVAPVSIFLLSVLIPLTMGLLLLPITLAWRFCFYYPLLGLSYLYEKYKWLRPLVAVIGTPIAIVGQMFIALMPSMGDDNSKMEKWLTATSFPYTYSVSIFYDPVKRTCLAKSDHYDTVLEILHKEKNFPLMTSYIDSVFFNKR